MSSRRRGEGEEEKESGKRECEKGWCEHGM